MKKYIEEDQYQSSGNNLHKMYSSDQQVYQHMPQQGYQPSPIPQEFQEGLYQQPFGDAHESNQSPHQSQAHSDSGMRQSILINLIKQSCDKLVNDE